MAQLTLFNEAPKHKSVAPLALKNAYLWLSRPSLMRGYEDSFPCMSQWDLAIGSGILAPSDAIDVCVSKHQSALIGGDRDSTPLQGRRPEDYRQPSRGMKAMVSCFSKKNDELRVKSEAICSWWEEQGAKR